MSRSWLRLLPVALMVSATLSSADPQREQREQSGLSVMGIDALRSPTHRETFAMVEYTPDPIEGFNRGSLAFTRPIIDWGLRPLAKGWRAITPRVMRESLENFHYNLGFPGRFVSLLLQAELQGAAVETGHFIVNSTVGVAGLFDPASALDIPTHREDVGLTMARWGVGPGFYVFLPVGGPSSGRDTVGRLFDMALHPTTWVPGSGLFFNVNAFSDRVDGYETLVESHHDLYLPVRALWGTQRNIAVRRYSIPDSAYAASDPEPSLGTLQFKVSDPAFLRRAGEHSVTIPSTGRELPYSIWVQKEKSPAVVVIPGIGSHRLGSTSVGLAELAWNDGYSVVIVSSPFHPEFVSAGLSSPYPGYTPHDAEDLYRAFEEIREDIDIRYGPKVESVSLMGYSLGAIETLFIADLQERLDRELHFDRFVAINPPVDLGHAAAQFDAYFDAPLAWPAEQRDGRVLESMMKAFLVLGDQQDVSALPFDRRESEFLIGFMGHTMLMQTLDAIDVRLVADDELTEAPSRGPLVQRLNHSSFDRYARNLLVPHLLQSVSGSYESIREAASLPSIEQRIGADSRIRVITNANDFILGDSGLRWLESTLGGRLTVFPDGGHLGNLHRPEVQDAVLRALAR